MVFSSLIFLFFFLPAALFCYYIVPQKFIRVRNAVLLLFSLFFYFYGEPRLIGMLIFSILMNYLFGLSMRSTYRKPLLILCVIANLSLLGVFKYLNFFISTADSLLGLSIPVTGIVMPIGISFYTFQALSYVIDVYRREVPPQHDPFSLALYVSMFPQLIAGPIVRYHDVNVQLAVRKHSFAQFSEGISRFLFGLSKKVLLSNVFAQIADGVFKYAPNELSAAGAWMGAIGYTLQITSISPATRIWRSVSQDVRLCVPRKLQLPVHQQAVTEFWRRWHITLGRWFRDYVYIPLGGSRKGRLRTMFNLFAVWTLTALWHGAGYNFLIWGGMLLGALFLEKLFLLPFLQKSKVIGHVYLLLFVPVTWMAFTITDVHQLGIYLTRMFPFVNAHTDMVNSMDYIKYLKDYDSLLAMGVLFATPVPAVIYGRIKRGMLGTLAIAVIFALSMYYLAVSANNPFLYFNF